VGVDPHAGREGVGVKREISTSEALLAAAVLLMLASVTTAVNTMSVTLTMPDMSLAELFSIGSLILAGFCVMVAVPFAKAEIIKKRRERRRKKQRQGGEGS
jgi:uncharacterized integral membrane protein